MPTSGTITETLSTTWRNRDAEDSSSGVADDGSAVTIDQPHEFPFPGRAIGRDGLTGEQQLSTKLNGPVLPIMPMGDYMPVRDRGG